MDSSRLEYKYLVSVDQLDAMRSVIKPFVKLDKFSLIRPDHQYTIRSVYFDTPGMDCYEEKIDGIKVRKKYRIRGYNDLSENEIIFLEIKRKYRNFISKNRAPLHNKDLENLFESKDIDRYILPFGPKGKARNDAQRFLFHYFRHNLSPKILVVYEREAFYSRFDEGVRITFDKNLRGAPFTYHNKLTNGYQLKPAMQNHFILELKFDRGLPLWAKRTIARFHPTRLALSKYTICLDACAAVSEKRLKTAPLRYNYHFGLN
jgi:hypothetical protein